MAADRTPSAAQRYREAMEKLHQAELAARVQEREGNEGDADAIRRDAIRDLLHLGPKDALPVKFEGLWRLIETDSKWWERDYTITGDRDA